MSPLPSLSMMTWLRAPETQAVFDALGDDEGVRFVGGCVRNGLMGTVDDPAKLDIDLATRLLPEEVLARLEKAGLKAVPTGLAHGTVTAVSSGRPFEITTLRKDVETHGRHATVAFSTDWAEDAARRDFTMNALYADRAGTVHDPLGGYEDLAAGRVRFIGDAGARIAEDYLRILRFFRFHAWYGRGTLDDAGLKASVAAKDHLKDLSVERVCKETLRLLEAPNPLDVLRQMAAVGVLELILSGPLDFDRFERLISIDETAFFEPDPILRLGSLLVGKHPDLASFGKSFRLSNEETQRLILMGDAPFKIVSYLSVREVRKILYRLGRERFQDQVRLRWAEDPKASNQVGWRALLAMVESWERPEFPLTGSDVMRAGVSAGPEVGRILGEVEDWWVDSDFLDDPFSLAERLKAIVQAS